MALNRRSLFGRVFGFLGGTAAAKLLPAEEKPPTWIVNGPCPIRPETSITPHQDTIETYRIRDGEMFWLELEPGCDEVKVGDWLGSMGNGRIGHDAPEGATLFEAMQDAPAGGGFPILVQADNWSVVDRLEFTPMSFKVEFD